MCFYNSTNNDLIEAKFFFLILRVKSWGVVGRGGRGNGGGGGGARDKWVAFILITVKISTQLTCFKN